MNAQDHNQPTMGTERMESRKKDLLTRNSSSTGLPTPCASWASSSSSAAPKSRTALLARKTSP